MAQVSDAHVLIVLKALQAGRLVPFLGAGVNRCGRPADVPWKPGAFLPDGRELAKKLAIDFGFEPHGGEDLLRVSEYVAIMAGMGPLRDSLHDIFNLDYPTTPVHRFFAALPKALRALGSPQPHQLIITTNYDDVMECAFREVAEPLDVLTYVAEGPHQGRFVHISAEGQVSSPIEKPNEYAGLPIASPSLELRRSLLVKIHGAVHRIDPEQDSYVITEDHYIEYLTRTNLRSLLPSTLVAKLPRCGFLFLGYGLRDWNLRAILRQIWGEQKFNYHSWAIQFNSEALDQKFWAQRDVEIIDTRLEDYIGLLKQRLAPELTQREAGGAAASAAKAP
jgi:hypothetical protein